MVPEGIHGLLNKGRDYMTYDEVIIELDTIRLNTKEIERIKKKLKEVDNHKFDRLHHVTDPSRDITKRSITPDNSVIEAIEAADKARTILQKKLDHLPKPNEVLVNEVYNIDGPKGTALLYYYLFGMSIKELMRELPYSE